MPKQSLILSPFTLDFYDSVLSLWRACGGIGLSDADTRENISLFLGRNPAMSHMALDGQKVVGAVLAGHDGRRGYLHHLAVHPDYRHRGVGRLLLDKAIESLRTQGINKCHGFVFQNNQTGMDFWKAVGWNVRHDIKLISRDISKHKHFCHDKVE
ncbi:MAG: GNAT family N-acetyltransferase [Candidatus Hydrogenedens sp.]|nr:GNAT family N-acetyltransferase [Candidatus Hydrogenedentota bacterium]NLF58094.1 GNAT family N-acetyltransferase [Candidatus Hydrogenedens sp.]